MARVAYSLLKNARPRDTRWLELDDESMDVLIFPSRKWLRMGIVLGNEALILDYKTTMSFRVRSGNLGFSKDLRIGKSRLQLNKRFLKQYFAENHDNPYGIQNIMNLIGKGQDITTATQFPPLDLPRISVEERKKALARLMKLGQKGDLLFSTARDEPISALIRENDGSQFSHVAPYLGNGAVANVGLDGGRIEALTSSDVRTHFALYSWKVEVSDVERQIIADGLREMFAEGISYDRWGALLMYLRNRFKLPVMRNTPGVADILFQNVLTLKSFF